MDLAFVSAPQSASGPDAIRAVLAFDGGALSPAADALGGVAEALARAFRFTGAKGQTLDLPVGAGEGRVLVVGAGARDAFGPAEAEAAAGYAFNAAKSTGARTLVLDLRGLSRELAARAALGAELASYRFDRYLTREKPEKKPSVTRVEIVADDAAGAEQAAANLQALAAGVRFTRDLVSEPANILFPAEFARRVQAIAIPGLEVEVLGEAQMAELGMGALLAVGQGSRRESQLVVMRWNGADDATAQPIAFVGKGVCFDTGGISIKPAAGMEDMKWDMGGAGVVAGLMHALAGRKAKVNAVGILGLVENMPDGNATRPGDIVTSMSGQTIEVLNTDAEGRLVLADALWYCQDRFKPRFIVDLATLTGAIIISLGADLAGLFSNDDALAGDLLAASAAEGEQIWRMPMPPAYDKQIDSPAADIKNIAAPGAGGGSILAALFLQRFIGEGLPWAHLDIAGVTWRKKSDHPSYPEGASGFGVRLLNRLVADRFEA
ncbi:MAG: leucyl aminopeptidase [Proteobacteria bacterium]|nr:leucyl aminopeptidase [Pseudomonadota bacterium]